MSEGGERAAALLEYLEERRDEMVDLLLALATLESPTDVPEAQVPVQAILTRALEERGMHVRKVAGRLTGGLLYARPRRRVRHRPAQLLIGHSDTVWPIGTTTTMPVAVENGCVRGPGTFDMKAGLVQAVFALEALAALELEPPATPLMVVNSDEEIGSPESIRWVRAVAKRVSRAFVLEPAYGAEGHLKTARKGVGRFRITVRGISAHAGLDPTAGASAIVEMANVVLRLHALTDIERGTTLNVGTVHGGTRRNVVAAEAVAEVDLRVATSEDGVAISDVIRGMQPTTPRTTIEVQGDLSTPPLESTPRNRALWRQARIAGERLGLALEEYAAGGASDGNTISQFTATLDGLGAIGDGAHARHESVSVAGMPQRAALLAELLMAPVPEAQGA
ncbi:MAG: M20/M25/M40 family metallo-hydrolase [Gemmatimonadales bacterium]